jgi:hypothetical protein
MILEPFRRRELLPQPKLQMMTLPPLEACDPRLSKQILLQPHPHPNNSKWLPLMPLETTTLWRVE